MCPLSDGSIVIIGTIIFIAQKLVRLVCLPNCGLRSPDVYEQ